MWRIGPNLDFPGFGSATGCGNPLFTSPCVAAGTDGAIFGTEGTIDSGGFIENGAAASITCAVEPTFSN